MLHVRTAVPTVRNLGQIFPAIISIEILVVFLANSASRIIQRCSRAAVPILLQLISRHFRATYMQAFCVTLLSEVVLRYYSAPFGHRAVRARGQIATSQFFFGSITVLQA
jgi:hypothetical protein